MNTNKPYPSSQSTTHPSLPQHIAIIMDGNGRWAKAQGLPRAAGHKKGAGALKRTLDNCSKAGIRYLTIYAFSSENWKRPSEEISDLMQLLQHYLHQELETLNENNICLRFIGDLSRLEPDIREQLEHAKELTKRNKDFHLTIALSYGSRQEIVHTAQKLAKQVASGKIKIEAITEELFAENLDTAELPEPDLLIRTGGEKRLSNFLLWQSAYTEFYFSDTLWPDFDKLDLTSALNDFAKRERRYGTSG
ncbi:MAG: isoprenyl transferase [Rickettsiales bacterium]|jgi:undecaprenyl diphosphate synthase